MHIPRKFYRGSDRKRLAKVTDQNQIAADLEDYINSKIKAEIEKHAGPFYTEFFYTDMAEETGYSEETIRKVCYGIDCGIYGFMVHFSGKKSDTGR